MVFIFVLYFVIVIIMYFNVNLNLINSIFNCCSVGFRFVFFFIVSKNKVLKYRRRLNLLEIDVYLIFVVG